MGVLTADMDRLRHAMQAEKDSIHKTRESLQEEISRFQEECQRIRQVINESEPVCAALYSQLGFSPGAFLGQVECWWLRIYDDGDDVTE